MNACITPEEELDLCLLVDFFKSRLQRLPDYSGDRALIDAQAWHDA